MPDALYSLLFDSSAGPIAVYSLAILLAALAVWPPLRPDVAAVGNAAASPLWLLAPLALAFLLLVMGAGRVVAVQVAGRMIGPLLVLQILLSLWMLWRHRHFPWVVLP